MPQKQTFKRSYSKSYWYHSEVDAFALTGRPGGVLFLLYYSKYFKPDIFFIHLQGRLMRWKVHETDINPRSLTNLSVF